MWFVYFLMCSDDSYYIGHTHNIKQRVETHNQGRGSSWTAKRLPVTLAYFEKFPTQKEAVQREIQLKKWSHDKKRALIQRDFQALQCLSKRMP